MARGDMLKARMNGQLFMLNMQTMNALTTLGNVDVQSSAKNEILYETINNVAVISVDGAMSKKSENGLCMSVYGYDTIAQHLATAEADSNVDTIIFRIDTPGGAVAGADDLEDRIFKSEKRTITIYENLGASAGVYVFSASDELYATKTTEVGSIGVKAVIANAKDESTTIEVVSKNATNKSCSLDGDCLDRLQTKLNVHEDMFISTVSKNTGMTSEAIISGFNQGDTIFAKDALEIGFLDGITTFHELLNKEVRNTGTIPTAKSNKIAKKSQGKSMELEEALAQVQALTDENSSLRETLAQNDTVIATAVEEQLATATSDAVAQFTTDAAARVQEAFAQGAEVETVIAMLSAKDAETASKILLSAQDTEALGGGDMKMSDARKEALQAKAKERFGA